MGAPAFKDLVASDISAVFLNGQEFADTHTIDGKPMTVDIPYADLPAFKVGTLYTMTVSIRGTELTVGGISIQDWTQQPVGGDGSEYVPL